jgi:adenylate kinase
LADSSFQAGGLFAGLARPGRRVVVTGQVGLDKVPFLREVVELARGRGHEVRLCNVGQMMYAEAPDVVPGRILDLPLGRLNSLRRAVFKEILDLARTSSNLVVNTHATFRWRHGVFAAFDHDQMSQLDADLYVTVVDSLDVVHEGLDREYVIDHSPKDVLVWREEEILATEVLAQAIRGHGCFFITARGRSRRNAETLYRLIFEPWRKKVYLSFPMTHVADQPELFREVLAEHLIAFDPGAVEEKHLLAEAAAARDQGRQRLTVHVDGRPVSFAVDELLAVAGDIDGQIYARDFKLIEQADMIVSYIPALSGGHPALASGVERELQHAFETTKEVYVIWRPKVDPSPFITETANRIFADLSEALDYFQKVGYIGDYQLPLSDGGTDRS